MSNMAVATVREVQHKLAEVLARVEAGEEVIITRRGKVIARLVPPRPAKRAQRWPDFKARMAATFGPTPPPGTPASALIDEMRGER